MKEAPTRLIALILGIIVLIAAVAVIQNPGKAPFAVSKAPSLSIQILAPMSPAPAVDSDCIGVSNAFNNNGCLLSTTLSPDLIIAEVGTGSSSSAITSLSDKSGLAWSLYSHYTFSGSSGKSLFVYYAFAASALSNDNVSVKFSNTGRNGLLVIAVNNYNPASPFDPASNPASSSSPGTTTAQVSPVSTANSNELVLGLFDIASNPTITPESGFTALAYSVTPTVYAEWEQLSAPASNFAVSATLSSSQAFLGTAFGIKAAPVVTTSSSFQRSTSTTSTTTTQTSTTTTSSTTSSTTSTSSSSSTSTSSSTSLTVTASSTGNKCFVNGYNSSIPNINAIYWECGATLQGAQSIKQNIFRSSELYGNFTLSINASQTIKVIVAENGVIVFSQTNKNIRYSGSVTQDEPMYVTVSNSQNTVTTYSLGIDWTSV